MASGWNGPPKRACDLAVSVTLLLALAPVFAACAAAVRVADGHPVLFSQPRVGRRGTRFRIYKFRTMRAAPGPLLTMATDLRITPLGRWLRGCRADELPQLWNVLRGEMSVVGPRPEVPEYVERLPGVFHSIADLRPGLTDWASLAFRDEEEILARHADDVTFYERKLLPRKLALARLYRRRMSPWLDLRLLLATACFGVGLGRLADVLAHSALLARARRGLLPERAQADV